MASNSRLLGQDTEIRIVRAGNVEDTLTDVVSFNTSDKLEVIEQGYLGETTNRHSQVYKGTTGSISLNVEAARAVKLRQDLVDRARRKTAYEKINILSTLVFPDGDVYRVLFPDIQVSSPKIDSPDRSSLVVFSFDWSCDAPTALD